MHNHQGFEHENRMLVGIRAEILRNFTDGLLRRILGTEFYQRNFTDEVLRQIVWTEFYAEFYGRNFTYVILRNFTDGRICIIIGVSIIIYWSYEHENRMLVGIRMNRWVHRLI